jgi:hypothetical protein
MGTDELNAAMDDVMASLARGTSVPQADLNNENSGSTPDPQDQHTFGRSTFVDPAWGAITRLKPLMELIPNAKTGVTRLQQCITIMRNASEIDQFADAVPDLPRHGTLRPITYPRDEANDFIEEAKGVILDLLDGLQLEKKIYTRLKRELGKRSPFFEEDDRGSLGALFESTGMTIQKERNNSKLDALAIFLDALRQKPYVVARYAYRLLRGVSIPPDVLGVDVQKQMVTYLGVQYPISELAAQWLSLLITADGQIVSTGDLKSEMKRQRLDTQGQIRPDRLIAKLPEGLCQAILTDTRGSRLDLDRLLSEV